MTGKLAGKVAVITGTGGGQGRAAALLFAAEGATVIGCDLAADRAEETLELVAAQGGVMRSTHPLDLADRSAVKQWLDDAAAEFGGIDILYNNASAPRFGQIDAMPAEQWHFTIRNELDIVFHVTQLAWPHLVARGGGAILNTASMAGLRATIDMPGSLAHAAAKAGVIGLTRELALDGGPHNIRVNTISPGHIRIPWLNVPALREAAARTINHQIIKRNGEPEDVAKAALFLLSDDASFITGSNLVIDGGYTAL